MRTTYQSVVMAGGGSRTFWHAGFWSVTAEPLALAPRQVATVSAAAAMACAIFSGRAQMALSLFKEATTGNKKNAYWGNALRGEPIFPHERMYRKTLLDLVDAESLGKIHAGPDIRVLLGHTPRWLGPRAGALLALAAYNFEKRVRNNIHPDAAKVLGFEKQVVSARQCTTPDELADLILASSCTPPMTSLRRWNGRYALDGGVIDNVPVCALDNDPGETLVLLTRRYKALPTIAGRTYVMPSRPIPVDAWDYTKPHGLQETFDLGRRDGETFLAEAARAQHTSASQRLAS